MPGARPLFALSWKAVRVGFAHQHAARVVLDPGGDPAAVGGAVTVALCGHWEHEPPCRWPHHTEAFPDGHALKVVVSFDAPAGEVAEVQRRIEVALLAGRQAGPDGSVTTWRTLDP
jgi:hypothetical protein